MPHFIRTQILDVLISRSAEAFHLQHALSSFFYRSILPELEILFDRLVPGQEVIKLDRLEIDLGDITEEEIEKKALPSRIREILSSR